MASSHFLYCIRSVFSQSFFISSPSLTEANLPDQSGLVALITGGYTGVGFEVASILYSKNATVWIAGRSESKGASAIERLQSQHPNSNGKILFLKVDLSDLTTIGPAATDFLRRNATEGHGKLHWLNNNAGIMIPPVGSVGAQGHDLQLVTNLYGPFLFTKLLLPTLAHTAALERQQPHPSPVRVSWAGSAASFLSAPRHGVAWEQDGKELLGAHKDVQGIYGITKAGNWWLAQEFGRRFAADGVLHNAYNPGNLRTELQRTFREVQGRLAHYLVTNWLCHPAVYGAYTELYAGLSPDLSIEKGDQGAWIVPWGRRDKMRADMLEEAGRGEKGVGGRLWEWCEGVVGEFEGGK